jgi:hypothetical protein
LKPFDPSEVYIFGTLQEAFCHRNAIAHWSDPNTALVGFDCDSRGDRAVISPLSGTLVYTETLDSIYEFVEDGCARGNVIPKYSDSPHDNDLPVRLPCADGRYANGILASPGGKIAVRCVEGWLDSDGTMLVESDQEMLAFDGERLLSAEGIFNVADQSLKAFVDLPKLAPLTARVANSGFWIVLPGEEESHSAELWHVDHEGISTLEGVYPLPPERTDRTFGARLSGDGALFQIASDAEATFNNLIVRRTVTGDSEVIYDELDEPLVKLHISWLVTGP